MDTVKIGRGRITIEMDVVETTSQKGYTYLTPKNVGRLDFDGAFKVGGTSGRNAVLLHSGAESFVMLGSPALSTKAYVEKNGPITTTPATGTPTAAEIAAARSILERYMSTTTQAEPVKRGRGRPRKVAAQ